MTGSVRFPGWELSSLYTALGIKIGVGEESQYFVVIYVLIL